MKSIIIKSILLKDSDLRMDASYHLSDGNLTKVKLEKSPYQVLKIKDVSSRIFYGGRSRRIYVSNKDKGLPFISSSDMLKSDTSNVKYVSKKYTKNLDAFLLDTDWTLISRSGTVGNTIYTNKQHQGKAASEHIIRVVANSKIKSGFLYAYLTTKYGYSLLTQGIFGAVIQHIEPEHIEKIPIPIFPDGIQQQIHDLIIESANLYVEANRLFDEVKKDLLLKSKLSDLSPFDYDYFGVRDSSRKVNIYIEKDVKPFSFNAFHYSPKLKNIISMIKSSNEVEYLSNYLNEQGIHSPQAVKVIPINTSKGLRLINQKEAFNYNFPFQRIAKRKINNENLMKKEDILIAGIGTLGENEVFARCIFGNDYLVGYLPAGNFIRLRVNSEHFAGYLYAWLASEYGFRLLRYTQTGMKQCMLKQDMLEKIPIPKHDVEFMKSIHDKVIIYGELQTKSLLLESQAIQLVEKEIEKWQQ